MPQWIKGQDRCPITNKALPIKHFDGRYGYAYYDEEDELFHSIIGWIGPDTHPKYLSEMVEWLDEDSDEPVFCLEDMKEFGDFITAGRVSVVEPSTEQYLQRYLNIKKGHEGNRKTNFKGGL